MTRKDRSKLLVVVTGVLVLGAAGLFAGVERGPDGRPGGSGGPGPDDAAARDTAEATMASIDSVSVSPDTAPVPSRDTERVRPADTARVPSGETDQARPPETAPGVDRDGRIARGRELFRSVGCARCHSAEGVGRDRYPLDGVGARLSTDTLRAWIVDPRSVDPAVRKPAYDHLPQEEVDALVEYLASLTASRNG